MAMILRYIDSGLIELPSRLKNARSCSTLGLLTYALTFSQSCALRIHLPVHRSAAPLGNHSLENARYSINRVTYGHRRGNRYKTYGHASISQIPHLDVTAYQYCSCMEKFRGHRLYRCTRTPCIDSTGARQQWPAQGNKKTRKYCWRFHTAGTTHQVLTTRYQVPYVRVFCDIPVTNSVGLENIYDRTCLLYTSPSPRDKRQSRMPSSA